MSAVVTPEAPRLRLTRRGRLVFGSLATVLVAALLALIAAFVAPQAQASNAAGESAEFQYVVIQPGETLWSLATELDSSQDPRDLVAEIVQLNQLAGSSVQAGEALAVPLRYADSDVVVSGAELGFVASSAESASEGE